MLQFFIIFSNTESFCDMVSKEHNYILILLLCTDASVTHKNDFPAKEMFK